MKRTVLAALASLLILPTHAQLFSRESLGSAAVGGLIGGIIGHNSGRKTAEGIGIGAGAGLVLGALAENSRREAYLYTPPVAAPVYPYYSIRPNYAVTGAALGGLAGGIIGHNRGRKTAEGIAIGAGTGLVLGAVAEENARRREAYVSPAPANVAQPIATPQAVTSTSGPATAPPSPQPATLLNNSYASPTPMSSANALFGR